MVRITVTSFSAFCNNLVGQGIGDESVDTSVYENLKILCARDIISFVLWPPKYGHHHK